MLQRKGVWLTDESGFQQYAEILIGDAGKPVTSPTTVYRIEMPNGNGPYNSGLPNAEKIYAKLCYTAQQGGYDCAHLAHDHGEQMGVTDKAFRDAHGHANYGCLKVEDLYAWFPEGAREYLSRYGAKIVEYVIPIGGYMLKVHDHEVIFNRHECHRVSEQSLIPHQEMAYAA